MSDGLDLISLSEALLLDQVDWSESRFEEIVSILLPFLVQVGYSQSRLTFVPCGAMTGENLLERTNDALKAWYQGPTIMQQLGKLAEVTP